MTYSKGQRKYITIHFLTPSIRPSPRLTKIVMEMSQDMVVKNVIWHGNKNTPEPKVVMAPPNTVPPIVESACCERPRAVRDCACDTCSWEMK